MASTPFILSWVPSLAHRLQGERAELVKDMGHGATSTEKSINTNRKTQEQPDSGAHFKFSVTGYRTCESIDLTVVN